MRLELIPVCDGSDIVLTLEIAALLSTDLLPFHTQIMFEINRIGNVPAIQSAGHRRIHIPIRALAMRGETLRIEWETDVRRTERLLMHTPMLVEIGKTPRATEIILGTGAAPRGILVVPIDVHLDFTLAPPAAFQRGERQIRADICATTVHAVEHHIVAGQFGDALATPLRMETHGVCRKRVIFGVIDLVEERGNVFIMIVAKHDARMFKRHGEIAVEAAIRHDHHRHRIDSTSLRVTAAEEVADRALHGRGFLAIPIEFQNQIAKHVRAGRGGSVSDGHPNMTDHARTVHIHQSDALPRFHGLDAGAALARRAKGTVRSGRSALAARGILGIHTPRAPRRRNRKRVKRIARGERTQRIDLHIMIRTLLHSAPIVISSHKKPLFPLLYGIHNSASRRFDPNT